MKVANEIENVKEKFGASIKENQYKDGIFTAAEIMWLDNYISKIHKTIKDLNECKKEKEEELMEALSMLKEAKKKRKVIENLKQRKLERYLDDLNRSEANELDDITQKIGLNKEKLTIEDVPLEDM